MEPWAKVNGHASETIAEYWQWLNCVWDIWLAGQMGAGAVAARSSGRLNSLTQFARTHSQFYRDHYRKVPADASALSAFPPVTKRELMARFDDWVTDRTIHRSSVAKFIADQTRIGTLYLDQYAVWTSSGTTGEPGLFVQDSAALAVYYALQSMRFGTVVMTPGVASGVVGPGLRYAMVGATGGHFAGVAAVERLRQLNPALANSARVFSIMQPLSALVEQLNEFQPICVGTYPTTMLVLAAEQQSGHLRIRPEEVWTGGETLSPAARAKIERQLDCRVLNDYGSSEFMSIACGCKQGWLHVNADWVILEPVDEEYRPVPAGRPSRTVLLTNLANRVQPIIRYDLGDSITVKPEPCACGSYLPAIRVEGRSDDVLALRADDGSIVQLMPLALATVVEEEAGVHRFQLVQTGPESLSVRLAMTTDAGRETWQKLERVLHSYLAAQGLAHVSVTRDLALPQPEARSGKLRQVIAQRPC
jgi:phenylacetate-CoA ligase